MPLIYVLLSVMAALVIAVVSLNALMRVPPGHLQNGPWSVNLTLGTAKANMYIRACTARRSTFALPVTEAAYFAATTDSAGNKLSCASTYSIEGRDPDCRWWSITAYKGSFLIPNPSERFSFSKTTIHRASDGGWTIIISPADQPGNWLPSGDGQGDLHLTLRLYGPASELLAHPANTPLPSIRRIGT